MRISRVLFLLLCLAVLGGVAYKYYPPFRLLTWVLAGRSPACPLSAALESEENLERQIDLKDEILNNSKLVEEDPKGYHLWDTPKGRFWIPDGSDYVLPFNLAEQERNIYGIGPNGPHKNDVVLDCGANVGVTVREELKAGAQKVLAIEPAPENLECLRRNFPSEIAAGRVVVVAKGVWDKEDFLTLRIDPKNSAADSFVLLRKGAVDMPRIPLTTIDHLVRDYHLDRVDYMKFDIEGAELKALAGAHDTLARWKPRISIASYHSWEHPKLIPVVIHKARKDYREQCGPCAETADGIRPDVLYFR